MVAAAMARQREGEMRGIKSNKTAEKLKAERAVKAGGTSNPLEDRRQDQMTKDWQS
jgi:hypothetical protein